MRGPDVRNVLERRIDEWRRSGAALDDEGLRYVRRARWWMPPGCLFLLAIALFDDRRGAVLFFGGIGTAGLLLVWPMMLVMLRGHAMRDRIDTRGARRIDFGGISLGVAGGVGLVGVLEWLSLEWPW